MISLFFIMGASCLLCVVLTPVARWAAQRLGLVDRPDRHRKIHQNATAVSGGLAILASCIAALLIAFALFDDVQAMLQTHGSILLGLLIGCVFIGAVGVADDYGVLRGRHKLLGQILAVSVTVSLSGWVENVHIFGFHLSLGWMGIPFTVFFLLGAINSLNLIDGMDGMLGSVGVILSLALAAMALLAGHLWAAMIALALAGALFGFLRYNLPPANIFLGDSGSMLVGLTLGTLTIHCSLKAPATIALAMPIALLVLPIFDTTAAIVRRKLTGRSIYTTDRGHLHHCLLRHGLSTPRVLVIVAICCMTTCAGVLASQAFDNEWIALITAASIIGTLVVTRLFGHAEVMLIKGRLASLLGPREGARQMEVRLQGSAKWAELWEALKLRAEKLNLDQLMLDVNAPSLHEGYHARWDNLQESSHEQRTQWHVEIPMTMHRVSIGRLVLQGQIDELPVWIKVAELFKVVEEFSVPRDAAGTSHELGVISARLGRAAADLEEVDPGVGLKLEPVES